MSDAELEFKFTRIAGCTGGKNSIELILDYGEFKISWDRIKFACGVKIKNFEGTEVPYLLLCIEDKEDYFYIDGLKISPRLFTFEDSTAEEKRLKRSYVTPKTADLTEKRFKWLTGELCTHLKAPCIDRSMLKCGKGGTFFLPVFNTMKDAALYCRGAMSSEAPGRSESEDDEESLRKISTPSTTREEWKEGSLIEGRYTVQEMIKGGMGIVYIVFDSEAINFYAVKTFQEKYLWNEKVIKQFVKEAEIWINLERHPNIVNAESVRMIEGKPYIFLEYISGVILEDLMKQELLPIRKSIELSIQFCEGMHYAFRKLGLIHRDIKPSNCFITRDWVLKISDFGLGKIFDESPADGELVEIPQKSKKHRTSSSSSTMVGTLPFMAPELFKDLKAAGVKSDIYSFGILFYILLTGINPFYDEDPVMLIERHLSMVPLSPQELNSEVPASLSNIAMKCLKKNPRHRYDNFEEIRKDLEAVYEETFGMRYELPQSGEIFTEEDWINKGESLAFLGRHKEAIITFDQALARDPKSIRAKILRGKSLIALEHSEEALECLQEVMKLSPGSWEASFYQAEAFVRLKNWQDALSSFDSALALAPDNPQILGSRGKLLFLMKREDEALLCFDQALEINPKMRELWEYKGEVCLELERYDEASDCFLKAIEINPRSQSAWSHRGEALFALGYYTEAAEAFRTALSLNPGSMSDRIGIGYCYLELGSSHKALATLDQALKVEKTAAGIYSAKVRILNEQSLTEESMRCLKEALGYHPGEKRLLIQMARLCLKTGELEKALEICDHLMQKGMSDWETALLRESSSVWLNTREDCMAFLKEISPPDSDFIMGDIGTLLSFFCDVEYALYFIDSLPVDMKPAKKYHLKAQLHYILGNYRESLIWGEQAIDIDPDLGDAKALLQSVMKELERDRAHGREKKSILRSILKKEADVERTPEGYLLAGLKLMREGNFSRALESYRAGLKKNPEYHPFWFFAGAALMHLGDPSQADMCFESFTARFPCSAGFYRYKVFHAPGDIDERRLEEYFQKWIALLPSDPHAWISYMKHLIERNRHVRAYVIMNEVLRSYANKWFISKRGAEYWNLRGFLELSLGRSFKALKYFARSAKINPGDALALLGTGECFEQRGNEAEALKIFQNLGCLEDAFSIACYRLTNLYLKQKMGKEALATMEKALKNRPDSPLLCYKKAQIYVETQDFWNFFGYYSSIYHLGTSRAPIYCLRTSALVQTGKTQEAISYIKNALSSDQENLNLHHLLGGLYLKAGMPQKAAEVFEEMLWKDELSLEGLFGAGTAYYDLENWNEAQRVFKRFLSYYPDDPNAFMYLGAISFQTGQYEMAEFYFSKALELRSRFARAWSNLGIHGCRMGKHTQAMRHVEKALRIDGDNGSAWLCRGRIQHETGDLEEALKNTERALFFSPQSFYGWTQRGIIEFKMQNFRQSLKSFSRAIDIDDRSPILWFNRGLAAFLASEPADAHKFIDRAIMLDPRSYRAWICKALIHKSQDSRSLYENALNRARDSAPEQLDAWNSDLPPGEAMSPGEVIPLPFDLPEYPFTGTPEPLHTLHQMDLDRNF